jgi:hypothetical protein
MQAFDAVEPVGPRDWGDAPVWIIGGGPSANAFPLDALRDRRTLAINDSAIKLPFTATALWTLDHNWMSKRADFVRGFSGERWHGVWEAQNYAEPSPGVHYVRLMRGPRAVGLSTNPAVIHAHGNSGMSGINLATLRGAKVIYLVGFDMTDRHGTHWHGGYEWRPVGNHKHYVGWVEACPQIKWSADQMGVKIFNLNPDSKIRAFPFLTFDEAFHADAAPALA